MFKSKRPLSLNTSLHTNEESWRNSPDDSELSPKMSALGVSPSSSESASPSSRTGSYRLVAYQTNDPITTPRNDAFASAAFFDVPDTEHNSDSSEDDPEMAPLRRQGTRYMSALDVFTNGEITSTELKALAQTEATTVDDDAGNLVITNLNTGEKLHLEAIDEGSNIVSSRIENFAKSTMTSERISLGQKLEAARKSVSEMTKRRSTGRSTTSIIMPQLAKSKNQTSLKVAYVRQVVHEHKAPIWIMSFSKSGKFLATAGKGGIIHLWSITPQDCTKNDIVEKMLPTTPSQTFSEHSSDVVDINWSKEGYLLSASLDQTVRLWHPDKSECIAFFQHAKAVTSVCFHPTNSWFISGSADKKLRLWDIELGRVKSWSHLNKPITATVFSPCGNVAAVGLAQGSVFFYKTHVGLDYYTEIECKNKYGALKNGTKITCLQYMQEGKQLLVTTNDSRMRIYCTKSFAQIKKFKGNINESMLIRGTASFDEKYIICGSENGYLYIWNTTNSSIRTIRKFYGGSKTNAAFEKLIVAPSNNPIVTVAITVPRCALDAMNVQYQSSIKYLLCTNFDGSIKLIETKADTCLLGA